MKGKKGNVVRYNRWGYFFLIPFAVVFIIFQLVPLCSTIYNSFFKHFFDGIMEIGPEPVGLDNYKTMFSGRHLEIFWKYNDYVDYGIHSTDPYITSPCFMVC